MLIDPGAARGLIGYTTFTQICHNVLDPAGMSRYVKWSKSYNKFSGISSTVQYSLGLVRFPIGLAGISNASYSAGVVDGNAAGCPGLVPLASMLSMGCVIACAAFPNGDGLLGIKTPQGLRAQRLYLTDSGHYLMAINLFSKSSRHDWDRMASKEITLLNRSARKSRITSPTASTSTSLVCGLVSDDTSTEAVFQ